jgi:aminopeptidase N
MLLNGAFTIKDDLTRTSWFVMLNELFLNGRVDACKYYTYLFSSLMRETEPQTRQYLLNMLEVVWWKFFTVEQRQKNCTHLEGSLFWLLYSSNIGDDERKPLFKTFTRIALSDVAKRQIFRIWNNDMPLKGVKLDEQDYMTLAYELAVRGFGNTDSILNAQELRIKNADRLAKFRFVRNAVTPDIAKCDIFFKSLTNPANRRPEPWVIEALHYLHHPLRASYSIKYIKPSLDLLPEIQRTGDIFFPKSWLEATFWGYSSKEAYQVVDLWLKDNQELQKPLRDKVLQSVDNLKRAAEN